jgi:chromosome transmission fidelity protein 18
MNLPFDTEIPTSFDPAIHLHSQLSDDAYAYEDLSTDLLELNQHLEFTRKEKNKAGIVVQHRAWKLSDVFRSEEDYPIGNLPASTASSS